MQQLALAVRLLTKPAIVRQAEPLTRRGVADNGTLGQFSVIWCEPSSGKVSDCPETQKSDEDQQNVAVSPTKPFVRAYAVALGATVGTIIDLRTTGRTFHSDA